MVLFEDKLYIFSGKGGYRNYLNDMLTYDINTETYQQVETNGQQKPNWDGPFGTHTAVVIHDQMYAFGGCKDYKE